MATVIRYSNRITGVKSDERVLFVLSVRHNQTFHARKRVTAPSALTDQRKEPPTISWRKKTPTAKLRLRNELQETRCSSPRGNRAPSERTNCLQRKNTSLAWANNQTFLEYQSIVTMKEAPLRVAYLYILILSFFFIHNGLAQGRISTKASHFEDAYKEYHYGIPFLYLQGTDYEVGLQYGNLMKRELTAMHEEFERFKEHLMEKEIHYLPWYERIFANLFGGMVWRHKIMYADRFTPDLEAQIRGAAEGSVAAGFLFPGNTSPPRFTAKPL